MDSKALVPQGCGQRVLSVTLTLHWGQRLEQATTSIPLRLIFLEGQLPWRHGTQSPGEGPLFILEAFSLFIRLPSPPAFVSSPLCFRTVKS